MINFIVAIIILLLRLLSTQWQSPIIITIIIIVVAVVVGTVEVLMDEQTHSLKFPPTISHKLPLTYTPHRSGETVLSQNSIIMGYLVHVYA